MQPMRIVIADDELNTRNGLYYILDRHLQGQHELLMAEHGLEAYEIIMKEKADIVFTDVRMPGMNGIELLDSLRKNGVDLISILLTGYADFEYARQGLRLGVMDYLLKPVEREKLLLTANQAMNMRRQQQQNNLIEQWASIKGKVEAPQHSSADQDVISKAIMFLHEHLSDEESSIKEVAKFVHLSPSYFSVLFKEKTGSTFSEYMMKLRHRKAKEMLLTTDADINLIADEIGYHSPSYFIRVFRELEGITPKQYRDRVRKDDY